MMVLGGITVVCLVLSCVIWHLRLTRMEKKAQQGTVEMEENTPVQA